MELTEQNYFSNDADWRYMSSTQYRQFMRCEAAALARIKGNWHEPVSTAMLVGSYVDAHFSGTLAQFNAQHPEIFKRDGMLKAEYKHADYIIQRVESDPLMMEYLKGETQTIMTRKIAGVPFKSKMDVYAPGKHIVDLKIVRDFKSIWDDDDGRKKPFIEAWGYDYQAAIYREVEGHNLPFIIAAATKEPEPDIALLEVPSEIMDDRIETIKEFAPRFQIIKLGLLDPTRCEKCDYCKATKHLTGVMDYREMI